MHANLPYIAVSNALSCGAPKDAINFLPYQYGLVLQLLEFANFHSKN